MADLVIVGGGPAGYVAALQASKLGKEVTLIEEDKIGGTCLNRGCIPTKSLLHSAKLYSDSLKNSELLNCTPTFNFSLANSKKEEAVSKLREGTIKLLEASKVNIIYAKAEIKEKELYVNDEKLSYNDIILCLGSKPIMPKIKGYDKKIVVDSNILLENDSFNFEHILIIGGGVIGVEFANAYCNIGKKVTIVEAKEKILPEMDKEISQNLTMQLKKKGATIITNKSVTEILDDGVIVDEEKIECDLVLMAVGRCANTSSVDVSIAKDNRGNIVVDDCFKTNCEHIYAVGDCIGGILLAHNASGQAQACVNMLCGKDKGIDLSLIPSCVYTDNEIACIGKQEKELKENNIDYKIGKFSMLANGKSIISESDRGFIKVISVDDYIIGASMMCERASDMLTIFSEAIANKLKVEDLTKIIFPHPSYVEGLKEAIEDIEGNALHIIKR